MAIPKQVPKKNGEKTEDLGQQLVRKAHIDTLMNKNRNLDDRRYQTTWFGNSPHDDAIQPMIDILKDKTEPELLRLDVITALGVIGNKRALEPIVDALKETTVADMNAIPTIQMQSYLLSAVERMPDKKELPVLYELLEKATLGIKSTAARIIGIVKEKTSLPYLQKALENELKIKFPTDFLVNHLNEAIEKITSFVDKEKELVQS